ncbi:hypothetical protein Bbelb_146010 [Branchiostoma belcheri]|nr:hypothetical protein Bbelb_146010 [Branchiostoma belcheri]
MEAKRSRPITSSPHLSVNNRPSDVQQRVSSACLAGKIYSSRHRLDLIDMPSPTSRRPGHYPEAEIVASNPIWFAGTHTLTEISSVKPFRFKVLSSTSTRIYNTIDPVKERGMPCLSYPGYSSHMAVTGEIVEITIWGKTCARLAESDRAPLVSFADDVVCSVCPRGTERFSPQLPYSVLCNIFPPGDVLCNSGLGPGPIDGKEFRLEHRSKPQFPVAMTYRYNKLLQNESLVNNPPDAEVDKFEQGFKFWRPILICRFIL